MPQLVAAHNNTLNNAFPSSRAIITTAVSIAINVNMADELIKKITSAVEEAFRGY